MEFEEACSEMNYILEHLNPIDLSKIPETVRNFFKENRSVTYKVRLTPDKNLEEQELKDETKALIQIINAKYFSKQSERESFIDMLNEKEELLEETKELVIYKENKIIRWIKNLLSKFKLQFSKKK